MPGLESHKIFTISSSLHAKYKKTKIPNHELEVSTAKASWAGWLLKRTKLSERIYILPSHPLPSPQPNEANLFSPVLIMYTFW